MVSVCRVIAVMAGDMKVWGELTDAEGTLRGDSRALDLLNVRYLLARPAVRLMRRSRFSDDN